MVMFNDAELKLIAEGARPSDEKVLLIIAAQNRFSVDPARRTPSASSLAEPNPQPKSRRLAFVIGRLIQVLMGR
ncbi:MAG: hypothetical protein J0I79_15350 [Mesorhizobium sp.]|nr:hypothetical protein [Mesorhizobium sp.]